MLCNLLLPACSKVGEHELAAPVCQGYGRRGRESAVVAVLQASRIAIPLPWNRQRGGDLSQEKFKISGKVVYFLFQAVKTSYPVDSFLFL